MVRVLVEAPRWLLVAALVFAPWAYGSTRFWALHILNVLLGGVCALWLGECVVRRRRPQVPILLASGVGGLLVLGWWMVFNAHSTYNYDTNQFVAGSPWAAGLPGSTERTLSRETMLSYTGLLGVLVFCCDLFQRPHWQKRIWLTLTLTGFSIAVFGILLKIGGIRAMALIWEEGKRDLTNNFATFRYRANAGAYLNLVLPLLGGLVFLTFRRSGRPKRKAFWLVALLVVGLAIQLNTSRAGWAIALGLGLLLVVNAAQYTWRTRAESDRPPLTWAHAAIALGMLVGILGIVGLGGWQTSWARIQKIGVDPSTRSPTEIYWKMAPDAGAFGFGPGTFQVKFYGYQHRYDFGNRSVPDEWVNGWWEMAHQDYLQTLLEWGYVGLLGWSVVIGGGLWAGIIGLVRKSQELSSQWLVFCSVIGVAGTLAHSFVDFPMQIASIQLFVCVLLGACWSQFAPAAPAPVRQSSAGLA